MLDTSVPDIPEGQDDDGVLNWFVLITSGTNDGEIRRASAYTASTGTITVSRAFTGLVANGVTYELHRADPALKHQAVNRAAVELFPHLYVSLRDETLVVDDVLSNSDFETFSGGFTDWTEVGSPTVTAETSRVYHGTNSAKVVAGGSDGQLTQAPSVNVSELAGRAVTLKMWVWTDAVSQARLRLDWDGSDIEDGDYHTGDSSWRLLSVSGTVPTSATQVKAILEVTANDTAYFDAGWMTVGPQYKYAVPSAIVLGPHYVSEQYNEDDMDGPYYRYREGQSPLRGRRLRLEGLGTLSQPTTDAGTMEVDEPHVTLIVAYAARWLARRNALPIAQNQRGRFQQDLGFWEQEVNRLLLTPGMRMARIGAEFPSSAWHVEEDASGSYVVFDRTREGVAALRR